MKKAMMVLLLLCVPWVATAKEADTTKVKYFQDSSTLSNLLLNAAAMNGSAANRTITVPTRHNWAKLVVFLEFNDDASDTETWTVTFTCQPLAGQNYSTRQVRDCSAAPCTLTSFSETRTTSGDDDLYFEYDVRACWSVQVLFTTASAEAGDASTVMAGGIVGD